MVFVPTDDGTWVSQEYQNLATVINDYDPYLQLRWIPPDKRTRDDKKPYVVVDTRTETPVLYASELDSPVDILERIFIGDNVKSGNVLDRMEKRQAAQKVLETNQWLDDLEQLGDETKFLVKSEQNVVKHRDKKWDDQRRIIGPAVDRKHII